MVHGRTCDKQQPDTFGVSGYVYRDVFLIYDRRTESLWYPIEEGKWTAIGGPRQGETLAFLGEPPPMPLRRWRELHPNTKVLLGSQKRLEAGTGR